MRHRFEDFVLDEATLELLDGNGDRVLLEPQAFSLLRYLVVNHDRVVAKTELLDEIWGDRFVSESALTTRIRQIRRAVADSGAEQRIVRTAFGTGYQFVAPVAVEAPAEPSGADGPSEGGPREPRGLGRPPRDVAAFGRGEALRRIEESLGRTRLVSLVGAGGIGKTHVLDRLGRTLSDRFDGGAVVVELGPLRSSSSVAPAVLEAVGGASGGADPTSQVVTELRPRSLLLLLDNAEHVTEAVAALCEAILADCPDVLLVVTSRHRLGVAGEVIVEIGPLGLDDATALFVERAADLGVELDPRDPQVRALCASVDGVPLAIELLASRVRLLSIADLGAEVGRHLVGPGPGAGDGDGAHRHTDIATALRWSLDRLEPDERRLLSELTVFAGSFDLTATRRVCGFDDPTEQLLALAEASLVAARPTAVESRFSVLEPIRLVADDASVDLGPVRRRHAGHFLSVAQHTAALLDSPSIDEAFDRFAVEWSNIAAAFETLAAEGDVEPMGAIVDGVADIAEGRLLVEVHEWAIRTHELSLSIGRRAPSASKANLARFLSHRGDRASVEALMSSVDRSEADRSSHVAMGFVVSDWYAGRVADAHDVIDRTLQRIAGSGGFHEIVFGLLRLASAVPTDRPERVLARLATIGDLDGRVAGVVRHAASAVDRLWSSDPAAVVAFEEAMLACEPIGAAGLRQLLSTMRAASLSSLVGSDRAAAGLADSLERGVASGAWSIVSGDLGAAARFLLQVGEISVAGRVEGARRAAGYRPIDVPALAGDGASGVAADAVTAVEQGRLLALEQAAGLAITTLRSL